MFRYDVFMNMCSSAAKNVAVSSSRTERAFDSTKNGAFAGFVGAAVIAVPFFVLSGILSISSAVLLSGLPLILQVGIAKCRLMESF